MKDQNPNSAKLQYEQEQRFSYQYLECASTQNPKAGKSFFGCNTSIIMAVGFLCNLFKCLCKLKKYCWNYPNLRLSAGQI